MGRRSNREAVLESGLGVVRERGFNATGVQDIAHAASIPKGSFYSYFPSKDDFGVAIVNRYADHTCEFLKERLSRPGMSPLERLRAVFEEWTSWFESEDCSQGCLMGNLSLEVSSQSPELRSALSAAFQRVESLFAACLEEARARGEIDPKSDPVQLATFVYAAWQGSVLRGKVRRETAPLREFQEIVLDRLLAV